MVDPPSRKLTVLLHADVVGSTALVRLDEGLAHQRMRDAILQAVTERSIDRTNRRRRRSP